MVQTKRTATRIGATSRADVTWRRADVSKSSGRPSQYRRQRYAAHTLGGAGAETDPNTGLPHDTGNCREPTTRIDLEGLIMRQPVVHFEIIWNDPEKLRGYHGELFGWEFDTPSPVSKEVSEPESYGFLNLIESEDGTGIRGGVGGGPGYPGHAVFYVEVPKVETALRCDETLGGTRVMGPVTSTALLSVTSGTPKAPL
jgi:predicted enzyme related to lactoylglutathione lyase